MTININHSFPDNRIPTQEYIEGYTRELALRSVGNGWALLIHRLFDTFENIKGDVKIIRVRERWGGLRVYTNSMHVELDECIKVLSDESYKVCEMCGSRGTLRTTNKRYKTLCDTHADEHFT
jgi:hypothetical protein